MCCVEQGADQGVRPPSPPPVHRDAGRVELAVPLLASDDLVDLLPRDAVKDSVGAFGRHGIGRTCAGESMTE